MIKILRENTFARNAILYFVVILLAAYVLVALGQAPAVVQSDTVTKIGDQEIRVRDIQNAKVETKERYRQFQLKDDQIDNMVSSSVLTEALMAQAARDAGIVVSDNELRDYIIKARTREDGSYLSNEDYRNAVSSQWGGVAIYENYIREQVIRNSKYREMFNDSILVSDSDVRARFEEEGKLLNTDLISLNIYAFREESKMDDVALKTFYDQHQDEFMTGPQRKIRYAFFGTNSFSEKITPSAEEITAYYNSHKDKPPFFTAERVRVRHILVKNEGRTPEEANDLIKKAQAELASGKAFEEVVNTYSDDLTTKGRKGEIGIISRGQYTNSYGENFENVIFGLTAGQTSDPFQSVQGWHIAKLDDKFPAVQQTLEEATPNITNILKNENGKNLAQAAAANFHSEIVAGKTFEQAATEQNVTVQESDFFDKNNYSMISQELGGNIKIKNQVFSAKEMGTGGELLDTGNGFAVFHWSDQRDPVQLEFDASNLRVKQMAEQIKGRDLLKAEMEKISKKLRANPEISLEDLKKEFTKLTDNNARTTNEFGPKGFPFQLSRTDTTFESLYSHEKGDIIGPIYTNEVQNDGFIVRITDKKQPTDSDFEEARERLMAQMRSERSIELLGSTLEGLRAQLDPNGSRMAKIQEVTQNIK